MPFTAINWNSPQVLADGGIKPSTARRVPSQAGTDWIQLAHLRRRPPLTRPASSAPIARRHGGQLNPGVPAVEAYSGRLTVSAPRI